MRLSAENEFHLSELATGTLYHVKGKSSMFALEGVCSGAGLVRYRPGDLGGDEANVMGHLEGDILIV